MYGYKKEEEALWLTYKNQFLNQIKSSIKQVMYLSMLLHTNTPEREIFSYCYFCVN